MSEKEAKETACCGGEDEADACCKPEPAKAGFFSRMFTAIDEKMKAKADAKAADGDCCGGSDGKGGKCC